MGESIKESRISGGDRAVAWDGETRGPQLTAQLKAISEQKAGCHLPWVLEPDASCSRGSSGGTQAEAYVCQSRLHGLLAGFAVSEITVFKISVSLWLPACWISSVVSGNVTWL